MAILLSQCATAQVTSSHKVRVHELEARPKIAPCPTQTDKECVTLLLSDWVKYVRELKAACLAQGQSPKECHVPSQ